MMAISFFRFKGRKRRSVCLHLAVVTGIILVVCCVLADAIYFRQRIYPGVQVKCHDLGRQPPDGAAAILNNLEITFRGPDGKTESFSLRELGIVVESEQVFDAAYSLGRREPWPLSYRERYKIFKSRPSVSLEYRIEGETLLSSVASLAEKLNTEPQDAFFRVCPYELQSELIPERPGYRIIEDELLRRLLETLIEPAETLSVAAPYTERPPAITASTLQEKGIETLMISFTTEFDMSNEDRIHNLRLAAAALDNRLLAPGDILSVNAMIGNTTPDKGYKKAPVIFGGDIIQGFGGGLCQVSSTLYNAVLLADLEILERHHHQFTVPYLPPGRDATIEYGSRDLLFRNNKDHHIQINALIRGNRLTIRLFGAPLEQKVTITTRELAMIEAPVRILYDPDLPPGSEEVEEGDPGYVVEVWKTVYRNDREESRVLLSVDRYTPYPTLIRRGPQAR
jgi:vancomycin resistance protein YoaR